MMATKPQPLLPAPGSSPTTALAQQTSKAFSISAFLEQYAATLPKKSSYPAQARRFVEFCMAKETSIDGDAFNVYTVDRDKYNKSALRHFILFYQAQGTPRIWPDPARRKRKPAANSLLLLYREYESRLEFNSKETYLKALTAFFLFLEDQQEQGEFALLRASYIKDYLTHLKADGQSAFTRNLHLAALKSLAKFCIEERDRLYLTRDQADDMRGIRTIKAETIPTGQHKDSLNATQRDQLLDETITNRERAILYLLAYEGLRTVEICRLQEGDLDLSGLTLKVQGKGQGGKQSMVLMPVCVPVLQAYLEERKPVIQPVIPQDQKEERKKWLFDTGKKTNKPLETYQVRYIVDKALRRVGLKKNKVSAHSLRHTVAQLLLEAGHALEDVQRHLRHKHIDTTQIYTAQKSDELHRDRMLSKK